MTTTSVLQEHPLAELSAMDQGDEVLSVYLSLALGRSVRQGHRAALENVLREARVGLDNDAAAGFDVEATRVMRFLENEFEPQGRTLIVFSSEPRGLWLTLPVQCEIESQARFGARPFLRPLEQEPVSDRTCFVVVDREQARVLTLRLGSVELDKHTRDFFPRQVTEDGRAHQPTGHGGYPRLGGDATTNEERSREAWADEHFEKTRDLLREIDDDTPFKHLILGGTHENVMRFMEFVPDQLRSRVAGEVAVEIDRPVDEFVDATAGLLHQERDRQDRELVGEALAGALSGGPGSAGWEDTLGGLIAGRVRDVVVAAGTDAQGVRCPQGHLVAIHPATCPMCGSTMEAVPSLLDLVDEMVHQTGAVLRIVNGEAAEQLRPHQGIGARLRY